jgi:hypothetical protein
VFVFGDVLGERTPLSPLPIAHPGKPGFLIFFTDISTRLTLYRFVFERGDEQYIVWDNPGTIAFMRGIERMGGVLQLRESR